MGYFLLQLFLIFLGLIRKQSNFVLLLLLFFLLFVSIKYSAGADLEIYDYKFESSTSEVETSDKSLLFDSLLFLLNSYGVSFSTFRLFCVIIWSVPIILVIKRLSIYPTWVVSVCMLFPILSFSSQIRNAFAVSFLYWGVYLLFFFCNKLNRLLYAILIIFAGFIHYVFFIYLLALIAYDNKIKTSTIARISLFSSLFLFIFFSSGILYHISAYFLGDYYADFYFSKMEEYKWKIYPLSFAVILNTFFSIRGCDLVLQHKNEQQIFCVFSIFVKRLNIILLTALPLLLITNHLYRIYQNIYILTAIAVANASYVGTSKGNHFRILYCVFYFIFVILAFSIIDGAGMTMWNSISL